MNFKVVVRPDNKQIVKLKWWNNNIFAICLYTWWLLNFSFLCFLCVFFRDYRQKMCDIWRNWAGIVSISLVFDTSSEFLMLLKNKNCEKALSNLSRNCLDSLAFDTSSAFIILLKNETDEITIVCNLFVYLMTS